LQKKIGAYREAIMVYLQILGQDLKVDELRKELYRYDKIARKREEEQRA
jgi:hypothetical protein